MNPLPSARSAHGPRPIFRITALAAACGLVCSGAALAQTAAAPPAAAASAAAPAAAASAVPPTLLAQAATVAPVAQAGTLQQPMTVVITGIRRSLESAMDLKRNAQGVVDGIVAEDIGKFPDTNLAESMQRITGVSIDRTIGEGSAITVRGVGPDFNLVLLNGRQMPASSIADTAPSNSRAFDFANLASESVSAIEVYKTSRASSPAGGIGATVNIKTARPLENPGLRASVGIKGVKDDSNDRLPSSLQGSSVTPEISGIFSNTFADGRFGIAISASYQERDLGFNQAAVPNGWRAFKGDENNWGTIPQPGTPGSENITNRPGPNDIYSVPQNLLYSFNGVQRKRTNGQLALQFEPFKGLRATLDHTYSENKIQTKRNELSAWFNFGPTVTKWTDGPAAAPTFYSEIINPPTSDIAMAGALYATRNENKSTGFNLAWKASDKLGFEFDIHQSTATSGADSPYGSNSVLGAASFNRGTTSVDFTRDFPVLSIQGSQLDASKMMVTGSSFRNSYMKSGVDQAQASGKWKIREESELRFGLAATRVENRTAFSNVQRDTWGGATNPGDYPDDLWRADTVRQYFGQISGSGDPALFNQFYVWDFEKVRAIAAQVGGDPSLYLASNAFTTDRRVKENSDSAYLQFDQDWEWGVPMHAALGVRYERTKITSTALVPTATGILWTGNNEFSVQFGQPGFTTLSGDYKYFLPSLDFDAELNDRMKLRASYGESIGRPQWHHIQGGQTLTQLARINGGTGAQGNPGLKPLKAKNFDLSFEYYYAKSSYAALGLFHKTIDNFVGVTTVNQTPFNLHTPAGGALFNEAVQSGCVQGDLTCIRNYIFRTHNGRNGVVRTGTDPNGNEQGTIAGQPGDPIATFAITIPANQRSSKLKGLEFNIQHVFGNSGFGVSANFTKVKSGLEYNNASLGEQFPLVGLSDSANFVGFYEDNKFSVRAAYNWRDKFLANVVDGSGLPNPVYTEAYGQWDVTLGYKITDNLTVQAEVINLTDEIQRQHGRRKEQLLGVTQTGRRYMFGARWQF
ncbi:TonB-dependent receptor [Aquincola sp. S2]|uniref:TonB-dependent receptor n=1 Tax=Pseudaquabacterium terrae TaxID=2732868 RepID=A0ABX2ECU6_9BURK|nr:TonB-dependent receptor [Aquabacterium terrae]NRF65773.1 TonB-dependent receptor [Aquabacterium terrae]